MKITQNQAHFSKFSIQNGGLNLYGKNEKQPPRKWTLFKNEERFFQIATGFLKMKVQSFQRAYRF
jgi:hypothetical protein